MPGLFGHCTAYYGMTEVQGGGVLHLHALFWIAGAPTTTTATLKETMSELSDAWTRNIINYTKSIVCNNLPINIMTNGCNCGAPYNELAIIPRRVGMLIPKFCYQRKTEFHEPALAKCLRCQLECSPHHLNRKWIINKFPDLWPPLLPNVEYTAIDIETRKHFSDNIISEFNMYDRPILPYVPDAVDIMKTNDFYLEILTMPINKYELLFEADVKDLILSYLVLTNNMHWYYHCHSCVKGGNKICRYDYPKPPNMKPVIKTDEILLERYIGNEYINGYNDVMMNVYKCNHDIKVMIGGTEMSERIYYCCKYITKSQNSVESSAAISIAFDKRLLKEEKDLLLIQDTTETQKSRRRMASMMLQLSNGSMEISGTLCALYIFKKTCAYRSHEYYPIHLLQYYNWLNQSNDNLNEVDCDYNIELEDNLTYCITKHVDDYIYRPMLYSKYGVYWFYSQFKRASKPKIARMSSTTNTEFLDDHPLKSTHILSKYQKGFNKIPVLFSSMKIPDYDKCDTDDKKNYHGKLTLLLFKPFRCVNDIKGEHETWDEAFQSWKRENEHTDSMKIYNNMQDFFVGRKLASITQKKR